MLDLNSQRKVLVVHEDAQEQKFITARLSEHVHNSLVITAKTGSEGLSKLSNDPPDIVFIQSNPLQISLSNFIHGSLTSFPKRKMAIIVLGETAHDEELVDEIVKGRLHFLDSVADDFVLGKVIARALNNLSFDPEADFHLKFLGPGEQLLKEGDTSEFVYILRSGLMKASTSREGGEKVLGEVYPGEFVGEMAYVNGETRSADVFAIEPCELIEISSTRMDLVLFKKPLWAKSLMQTLAKRLQRKNVESAEIK